MFKKLKKHLYILPTVLLFSLFLFHSVTNIEVIKEYKITPSVQGVFDFTNTFEDDLKKDFKGKYAYINLNGGMAAALGNTTLNEREKLANGHLTISRAPSMHITALSKRISALSDLLKEDNTQFLCVPVPGKKLFYDVDYSTGYKSDYTSVMDDFEDLLNKKGVNNINVNTFYKNNKMTMDDIYFKTDHHWKPETALKVTEEIMKTLAAGNSKIKYDPASFTKENWETKVYKDWFLGSHGKRTGKLFAGVDDLSYIYPKFETEMTVDRINSSRVLLSDNLDSVYDKKYLEKSEPFKYNAYCLYLGGEYPVAYMRNPKAVNKAKLVVIGDSFRLPAESFLTTQFSEICRIDTRYYKDGTFAEFVKQLEPDAVLMLFTSLSKYSKAHIFGVDEWYENFDGKSADKVLAQKDALVFEETDQSNNFTVLQKGLKSGSYEMTVGNIDLKRNNALNNKSLGSCLQMSVFDNKTGKIVASRYFLSSYGEGQKWLFNLPENKNADYKLVVYNGMNKDTKGNSSKIESIKLTSLK